MSSSETFDSSGDLRLVLTKSTEKDNSQPFMNIVKYSILPSNFGSASAVLAFRAAPPSNQLHVRGQFALPQLGTEAARIYCGNLPLLVTSTIAIPFGTTPVLNTQRCSIVLTAVPNASVPALSRDAVSQTVGNTIHSDYHSEVNPAVTITNEKFEIHMLVSSRHMILASPVFAAMLTGNFKEARALQSDGKVDIELPDDDADAFRIILNIIHSRNKSVPTTISLDTLKGIAVLADKYQMVEAVESYSERWVSALMLSSPYTHYREMGKWICICWVFDLAPAFATYTQMVVRHSVDVPSEIFLPYLPLPQTVHDGINALRQRAIAMLYTIINRRVTSYMSPTIHCTRADGRGKTCDALVLGTLLKNATNAGCWPSPSPPYSNTSYEAVAAAIRSIDIESLCDGDSGGRRNFGQQPVVHGMKSEICIDIDAISEGYLTGLVLSEHKRGTR